MTRKNLGMNSSAYAPGARPGAKPASPGAAVRSAAAAQRRSGAVHFWAVLGLAVIALALSNWTQWIASDEFVQPDPGADPYPYLAVLRATEAVSISLFFILGWITVLGPKLRDGRLSLDGKMFIGGLFSSTLDVLYSSFNVTWAMNAHAVSFGTWAHFFPGYPSPGAESTPWGCSGACRPISGSASGRRSSAAGCWTGCAVHSRPCRP